MAGEKTPREAAMAVLGTISGVAAKRGGAAAAMQAAQAEFARLGHVPTFQTYTEVAKLYGQTVALRTGAEQLAAAPGNYAITSEYLAQLPYGAGPAGRAGPRIFHVRVGYSTVKGGVESQDFVTLRYTGGLPESVGALRQEAADIAISKATEYGSAFGAVTAIQIGEW